MVLLLLLLMMMMMMIKSEDVCLSDYLRGEQRIGQKREVFSIEMVYYIVGESNVMGMH